MAQDPLHLLCVEPRFPGRLGAVADWLVRKRGYRCRFLYHAPDSDAFWPPSAGRGLEPVRFGVGGVARESAVAWTRSLERGICYTYGAWEVVRQLPPAPVDVVLGRSAGLGSTLFLPVALPHVPIVNLFDYYVHPRENDLAAEIGPTAPEAYFQWRRSANAMDLLDLESGLTPWAPTAWQRDLYPAEYRDDFVVLFDGVDPARFTPRRGGPRTVAGRTLPAGTRLVTFVAHSLDRVRGFDRFLALADRLMKARSDVVCVAVGEFAVHRGLDVEHYQTDYRAKLLAASPPADPQRLWLTGPLPPAGVGEVLGASDLHVYPGRPYPVARSLVEAMAAGCVVLAWDAEPVREFVDPGKTGLLVGSADEAERMALAALADPAGHRPLGEAAAELVRERYDRDVTLPRLAALFDRLVGAVS